MLEQLCTTGLKLVAILVLTLVLCTAFGSMLGVLFGLILGYALLQDNNCRQ